MPRRYQIHCVARSDRFNHHQRLRRVGGVNRDGARWTISEADAIAAIEAGRWAFFLEYRGREWDVVVTVSKYGDKYLRTAADGLHPDSLLSLPECG
jgi:hypothetical protein